MAEVIDTFLIDEFAIDNLLDVLLGLEKRVKEVKEGLEILQAAKKVFSPEQVGRSWVVTESYLREERRIPPTDEMRRLRKESKDELKKIIVQVKKVQLIRRNILLLQGEANELTSWRKNKIKPVVNNLNRLLK